MHDVLDLGDILSDELAQRVESGFDVGDLEADVRAAVESGSVAKQEAMLGSIEGRPARSDWSYEEPSDWPGIQSSLGRPELPALELDEEALRDRLEGAWLGRCAGCNLGKPVEGWSRERIRNYLDLADAYPIDDYLPRLDPFPDGLALNWCWPETTRGNIRFMARDDDTDYTILGLHVLEEHGTGFGAEQVGHEWLHHLPFAQTYTAERAAYRNLIHGLQPPHTATFRNPYREWIGAQIRGDMWGYVSPGDPAAAAELAFRDASLSHTQNGIYGEMWASALIASCFVVPDLRSAIESALGFVPPRSRLAEAVRHVLGLFDEGRSWEETRDAIEVRHGHYSFVHTINNSAHHHGRPPVGTRRLQQDDRPRGRGGLGHGLHRRDHRFGLRGEVRSDSAPRAVGRAPERSHQQRHRRVRQFTHLRPRPAHAGDRHERRTDRGRGPGKRRRPELGASGSWPRSCSTVSPRSTRTARTRCRRSISRFPTAS